MVYEKSRRRDLSIRASLGICALSLPVVKKASLKIRPRGCAILRVRRLCLFFHLGALRLRRQLALNLVYLRAFSGLVNCKKKNDVCDRYNWNARYGVQQCRSLGASTIQKLTLPNPDIAASLVLSVFLTRDIHTHDNLLDKFFFIRRLCLHLREKNPSFLKPKTSDLR